MERFSAEEKESIFFPFADAMRRVAEADGAWDRREKYKYAGDMLIYLVPDEGLQGGTETGRRADPLYREVVTDLRRRAITSAAAEELRSQQDSPSIEVQWPILDEYWVIQDQPTWNGTAKRFAASSRSKSTRATCEPCWPQPIGLPKPVGMIFER